MRDTPESVMLFAAGFGTRMGALTADRPKPLINVAGKALIDHALDLTTPLMPLRRVVNLHYRAEQLDAYLADTDVTTITETPKILETGGGLRNALPVLGAGPVFTMNTDAVWNGPNPLEILKAAWRPNDMDALVILIDPDHAFGTKSAGDFAMDAQGRLTRGPGAIYGGVQIIRTEGLSKIDETVFSLNLLWDDMIARGRLCGVRYPGFWCDVGHPAGITLAEEMLNQTDV